jgi:hypothetical protein
MIYVNNAELEKIFGSSSNITFSTVQVEKTSTREAIHKKTKLLSYNKTFKMLHGLF